MNGELLGVKAKGMVVEACQSYAGWVKLVEQFEHRWGLTAGWMLTSDQQSGILLEQHDSSKSKLWRVVFPMVNVRRFPGARDVTGMKRQGNIVEVVEERDGWVRIAELVTGGDGWIMARSHQHGTLLERCPVGELQPAAVGSAASPVVATPLVQYSALETPTQSDSALSSKLLHVAGRLPQPCAPAWRVVYQLVNVRCLPQQDARIVGAKHRDQIIDAVEELHGWVRLAERFAGGDGWMLLHSPTFGTLLEVVELRPQACAPTWRVVFHGFVNVRRVPRREGAIVGQKNKGDSFDVVEELEGWLRLVERFDGGDGWIRIHDPAFGKLVESESVQGTLERL